MEQVNSDISDLSDDDIKFKSDIKLRNLKVILQDLKHNPSYEHNTHAMTPRRSRRQINKPAKYQEDDSSPKPTKLKQTFREECLSEENSSDDCVKELPNKKSGSKTNKKLSPTDYDKLKSTISNMEKLSLTPKRTPRKSLVNYAINSPLQRNLCEGTPKHVKEKIKKRIIREVESESEQGSDFSADSSDFVPEDSDDGSDSNESSNDSEESHENSEEDSDESLASIKFRKKAKRDKCDTKMSSRNDFVHYKIASDNYFMMNSGKKNATSDHTLERLKNRCTDNSEFTRNMDSYISHEHKRLQSDMIDSYKKLFSVWLQLLNEEQNLLLHGIGSKIQLLQSFSEEIENDPCVVINGFFPGLTIKSILESITVDILGSKHVSNNTSEVITFINEELIKRDIELYLIINNIDGEVLKSGKVQSILANLAKLKNVHVVASSDHVYAPFLWNSRKLRKFNFVMWDVTTLMPYEAETSYESAILSHRSDELQLSSLRSVHKALTSNAKGIFNVMLQYQLENQKRANYQGLPFKELYSRCRRQFLVSTDVALRAQLTEFLDHKLVRIKRTNDGSENLLIPIDKALLQQFLDQTSLH